MFEYGDKDVNVDWFDEGPTVVVSIKDAVNTGSIDTSAVDKYRQGVEITCQKHWTNGVVKIHVGETNHVLKRNSFGQTLVPLDHVEAARAYYVELDTLTPEQFINDVTGNVPIDAQTYYPYYLNGIIEPLPIRSFESNASFYTKVQRQSGVKGHLMAGNVDTTGASDIIVHVHKNELDRHNLPFIDSNVLPQNSTDSLTRQDEISIVSPYVDVGNTQTLAFAELCAKNALDFDTALGALSASTENYVPTGSFSPTSGFVYDNTIVGTDSIAFGGLRYMNLSSSIDFELIPL